MQFISKISTGQKYGGFLLDSTKTFTDCFVLEVSTVGRFQNGFCIASIITSGSQDKENKILCIAIKKWKELLLTLDNSKSEDGRNLFKTMRVRVIECEFL